MALPVALLAGAAIGAGQMAYGASQKKKYQNAAAANVMPEYQINPEEGAMMRQAESMAGQGMSDAARESMRANTDRALGTGIDAILRGGGNANAIASLAGNTQNQINQMAVYEDQARLKNLENLQNQRARMSANRDKVYQINQYQPWANRAQAINQQLMGAQNMMQGGFNTMAGGLLQGISNMPQGGQRTPFMPAQQPQMNPMQLAQMQNMQQNQMPYGGYMPQYANIPQFNYMSNLQDVGADTFTGDEFEGWEFQ
jgi:hypothetical protein